MIVISSRLISRRNSPAAIPSPDEPREAFPHDVITGDIRFSQFWITRRLSHDFNPKLMRDRVTDLANTGRDLCTKAIKIRACIGRIMGSQRGVLFFQYNSLNKLILTFEIRIHCSLTNSCPGRDFTYACRTKAFFRKAGSSSRNQLMVGFGFLTYRHLGKFGVQTLTRFYARSQS